MIKKHDSKHRRVVVTGLGVISSIGIGWEEFWKNLIAGKSGISSVTLFDTKDYERHLAGEVKNFEPSKFVSKNLWKFIGRTSQMLIAASKLALKDARFPIKNLNSSKVSVCVGTTTGEIGILEKFNNLSIKQQSGIENKRLISLFPSNSLSSNIALELKISGQNCIFATACASGNYSLGYAYDLIRSGKVNYALAGGGDGLSRIVFTGFNRLIAIAPEKCQPFDKKRKGMIPGEGAGILFLESLEEAKHRNAHIYAEILGYGLSCDGTHMTNPSVKGISMAIKRAIKEANVETGDIDFINAHGTGTIENDKAESAAISKLFGREVPVSSIKSMLGHTMGAASALEAISCCLTLQYQQLPPTINYEIPDLECAINCVANFSRFCKVNLVLNNSQAFGGNNAGLIFSRLQNQ